MEAMEMTKQSRRTRRVLTLAGVVVAIAATWIANDAVAQSRHDFFLECTSGKTDLFMQQKCCEAAGGTWVVENHPDGLEIYKCVNIPAGDMPTYAEQPEDEDQTWTNNTQNTSTTGTSEQVQQEPAGSEPASDPTYSDDGSWESGGGETTSDGSDPVEESVPRNRASWYD
jgi:hypothetical protein